MKSSFLPPIEKPKLSKEALAEANQLREGVNDLIERQEGNKGATEDVLDQAVKDNDVEITQARKDFAASFVSLAVNKGISLAENELIIDKALEADPELFEEITKTASKMADNFKSDPAGAKTAFDKLQDLYKDGGNPSVEAINDIADGKDDTALQMLKNGLAEVSKSEVSDGRKVKISQKLLHHFAFVGDGQDRDVTQAAEQSLMSWARLEADPSLALTEEEKVVIGAGFQNAAMAPSEIAPIPEPELKKEQGQAAQEIETPPVESEEEEELKKKKSATQNAPAENSVNPSKKDEKTKKGISSKQLEDFAKASAKPAIRICIALACLAIPGVGFVAAGVFLAATSPKDEKKKDSEKLLDGEKKESEVEKYLKEKMKIANAQDVGGVATEAGKAAATVELKEGGELKKAKDGLAVNDSALQGVGGDLPVPPSQGKIEPPLPPSDAQEENEQKEAIQGAVKAINNANRKVPEGEAKSSEEKQREKTDFAVGEKLEEGIKDAEQVYALRQATHEDYGPLRGVASAIGSVVGSVMGR